MIEQSYAQLDPHVTSHANFWLDHHPDHPNIFILPNLTMFPSDDDDVDHALALVMADYFCKKCVCKKSLFSYCNPRTGVADPGRLSEDHPCGSRVHGALHMPRRVQQLCHYLRTSFPYA